jgi:hypothetical protein
MKTILTIAVTLALVGCGASYSITRTAPGGASVSASAWVAEKQGTMQFTFDGDPNGSMTITLDKTNVEPTAMPADLVKLLMSTSK